MKTLLRTFALILLFLATAAVKPLAHAQIFPPSQDPGVLRIAVVGDYGDGSQTEADVAALIHSWQPDYVLTVGDNNYPVGAAEDIDAVIGRFFNDYIAPYRGDYGDGAAANQFFPALGNHDWGTTAGEPPVPQPYLDYFSLPDGPGQERYYDMRLGPVHIFTLDSDPHEPDGVAATSPQARWLQDALAASDAPWKLVVLHHAPYSSGLHGSTTYMRWPFGEWGADAVLAGHDHDYERLDVDGLPYFVNGLGGDSRYWFLIPLPGSQARYNKDAGAMLIEATPDQMTFQFITRSGELIDSYTIDSAASNGAPLATQPPTQVKAPRPNPFLRPSQRQVE
ncbi:MAG: metallophosphoesterase [Anaerolineales bacterium]|nr:metallophosphoesterase [Anaerolineae bacterium]MCB9129431.1 metallophosphoesterase [Anaerolineales bacterium]MCB9143525.1 metallophosphoesterase [Anaerolineales bacterium]MCO5245606.1 metallophosphoesterase [Anaerolineae bacterium]